MKIEDLRINQKVYFKDEPYFIHTLARMDSSSEKYVVRLARSPGDINSVSIAWVSELSLSQQKRKLKKEVDCWVCWSPNAQYRGEFCPRFFATEKEANDYNYGSPWLVLPAKAAFEVEE